MRAAPAPRRALRSVRHALRAAVQPATTQPSMSLLSRQRLGPSLGPQGTNTADRRYLANYQGWQNEARRAARTTGVARFAANMVAATAARVVLHVEERNDNGEWVPTEQTGLSSVMEQYGNETLGQGPSELLRLHTWHYQISGEGCIANQDNARNVAEWMVLSMPSIEFGVPNKDTAKISLVPGGSLLDGTAFLVPRDQVVHFWMPDEDWLAYAVSPMTAAMEDLGRYNSLARHARRQADSYLAMNGALWTPSAAHESDQVPGEAALDSDDGAPTQSPLLRAYEEMARVALNDGSNESLESVVPPMWWWDGDTKPEWVEVGRPLDEHGIAYRSEALGDFARDLDVPGDLVTGGGSDQANHWNAWMTKERFIGAVQPTLDRVTHQDLTVTFLYPILRFNGTAESDLARFRVGYDPAPVIQPQDESDKALRAWLAGLLKADSALSRMGFDPSELADATDLARLAAVLSNFASGVPDITSSDGPVGPGTVVEGPPPNGPPAAAAVLREFLPRENLGFVTTGNGNGTTATPVPLAAPDPVETAIRLAAALNPTETGIMLSLDVPPDVAKAIVRPDGEPVDAMHVTLVHLPGGVDAATGDERAVLSTAAAQVASSLPAPTVDLTHVERFVAGSEEGLEPVVLVDHGPDVYALREKLVGILDEAGLVYSDDHGFRCHVTLGYYPPGEGPENGALDPPVSFVPTGISLHWGGDVETFPFGQPSTAPPEPAPTAGYTAAAADPLEGLRAETAKATRASKRALAKLARIRRDAGRELKAAAELALAEALTRAGVRAVTKAKNKSAPLAASIADAIEQGSSLRPFFGALGANEERLLAGAFDGFEKRAAAILDRSASDVDSTSEGETDDGDRNRRVAAAAAFLAAVLLALARRRILAGESAAQAIGEVSGDVPAGYMAQAVGIAEGTYDAVVAGSPDAVPTVVATTIERAEARVGRNVVDGLLGRLKSDLAGATDPGHRQALERAIERAESIPPTTYEWTWGFWSSPDREFEPHFRLNGTQTTDPEGDPAFANDGDWPDGGFYQPDDHDGCSCELVAIEVDAESVLVDA